MADITPESPKLLSGFFAGLPRINPLLAVCVLVIVLAVGFAVFADVLAPYGFAQIDLRARKMPPLHFGAGSTHWLGTDEMGRDILSRIFYALRMSILISLGASIISMIIGTALGLISSFRRGLVDAIIRVAVDFQASMPFIIIALTVLAFLGNSLTLFICLLGLFGWERFARLTRTMAGLELGKPYIAALHRNGAGSFRIAMVHVLPNILAVVLVTFTVVMPEILILESSLSFLGLGVQPPQVSLGSLVGAGRDYIMTEWWIAIVPGVVIFVLSLTISLIGDQLRDIFDPTLK
ncbi:ABC transporter permease [Dickeya solani]|uniref:ABC transporter permease n=1 Tax=Dickeya solani TaxID=1089444 RepID=A0ABU4EA88_9GAMM|nr:ABC transporter permease [Dickeya solani]MCA6998517.1 ABC transporter permease [Dickeya solani]MCZ0821967.1 ABC transporter permease [Dickeya solani]MDV6996296.1 ABC transporter permease [Dickeya solani]MDV7005944.1 ABC transporter permease [Dickeya solani]MDV7039423.1 ABC transporter permease [Dickeya solani]